MAAGTVWAVLCLAGCASSRKSEAARGEARTEQVDSTMRETLMVTAETVPQSEVCLTIETDSLLDLPEGASYHAKNGQANLDVSRGHEPGTIVVYASCDSLRRMVAYYEHMAGAYKKAYERHSKEMKEEKKPPDGRWKALVALAAGMLAGTVITLKYKRNG